MDCGQLFGSLKPVNQNLGVKRGGQRTWERNVLEAGHTNHPPPPPNYRYLKIDSYGTNTHPHCLTARSNVFIAVVLIFS